MLGLDIIGAGEALAPYTIVMRVKSIDSAKLRQAVSDSSWGSVIPGALQIVDSAPELSLEVALPVVKAQLQKIGIMADITKTKTPPKGTTSYEMVTVLGFGTVLGVVLALFGKTLYHLIKAR